MIIAVLNALCHAEILGGLLHGHLRIIFEIFGEIGVAYLGRENGLRKHTSCLQ